jgi:LacI family transcriptional regulator
MNTEKQTKYAQLAQHFRLQIEAGALRPGDRLSSFAEMRALFGASPLTVDRAFSTLEKEGLIVRVQGSGTFVAEPAARKTKVDSAGLIGLLLPSCTDPFFLSIIEGVEEAARQAGYHLIVANWQGDPALEVQQIASLARQTVGVCSFPGAGSQEAYAALMRQQIPFVFVDRCLDGLAVPIATSDNERGGYLATRHLLELGRRHIYLLSDADVSPVSDRIRGYRRALKEARAAFDASLVRRNATVADAAGYTLTRALLEEKAAREPFGIFAINDSIARGCYLALKEANKRIPQDVAVVGFDDTKAPFLEPPLSTVRQDLRGMGTTAANLLIKTIRTGRAPRSVALPVELIVRDSTDAQARFCPVQHILESAAANEVADAARARGGEALQSVLSAT